MSAHATDTGGGASARRFDELWPGGPRFFQGEGAFPVSTDSVLLAWFARNIPGRRVIDLGCGAGVLTVLLAAARPDICIDGIEIQPGQAQLCRENLRENGFACSGVVTGDLREHRRLFPAGGWDLALANPPYFAESRGLSAPDPRRAAARDERLCTLADLSEAAGWLCRWGGSFCVVYRPERLAELFCALSGRGLEPKRLRLVQHRAESAPSLVLLEARRGGRPGLRIEPPLLLTAPDGGDSAEVKEIYHRI